LVSCFTALISIEERRTKNLELIGDYRMPTLRIRGVWVMLSATIATGALDASLQQTARPPAGGANRTPEQILELHTGPQAPAGVAETGRAVFEKTCASCHRFGSLGTEVGPELTTIASRLKKKEILESILWPSKAIADQYKTQMFELKDGTIVTGVLVKEDALRVTVTTATAPDKPTQVLKGQIANRAESAASLMPERLLDPYTDEETAGLLVFLLGAPPREP
jgi:putative heme-binding domain-containing protein